MPTHSTGSIASWTASATPATNATPKATGRPGKTTGAEVISSWSLAKVTMEPAKDTEPTKTVNPVAARSNQGVALVACCSSRRATSAAAPPPTPLNSATICGICVICTRRAPTTPPRAPIAIASRISGTWCRWSMPFGR